MQKNKTKTKQIVNDTQNEYYINPLSYERENKRLFMSKI